MARAFPGTPSSEMIPFFNFIKRESGLTGSPLPHFFTQSATPGSPVLCQDPPWIPSGSPPGSFYFLHGRHPLDPPLCDKLYLRSPADSHLDPLKAGRNCMCKSRSAPANAFRCMAPTVHTKAPTMAPLVLRWYGPWDASVGPGVGGEDGRSCCMHFHLHWNQWKKVTLA